MGRTTTLGRRPYSPKDADTKLGIDRRASLTGDVDESKPQFPRFKPRIGTQYQSKVPRLLKGRDESTASSRPKPDQMSTEIHHLTMLEVQEARGGRKREYFSIESHFNGLGRRSALSRCRRGDRGLSDRHESLTIIRQNQLEKQQYLLDAPNSSLCFGRNVRGSKPFVDHSRSGLAVVVDSDDPEARCSLNQSISLFYL